jgi:hypothetical protein
MSLSRHHLALVVVVLVHGLQARSPQLQFQMMPSFHLKQGLAKINPHSALYPPFHQAPSLEAHAPTLALPFPPKRPQVLEQWSHLRIEVMILPILAFQVIFKVRPSSINLLGLQASLDRVP